MARMYELDLSGMTADEVDVCMAAIEPYAVDIYTRGLPPHLRHIMWNRPQDIREVFPHYANRMTWATPVGP